MLSKFYSLLLLVFIWGLYTACDTDTENNEANIDPADLVGLWRADNGAEFSALTLFPDNTFGYAENDLSATSPAENSLEAGIYFYDSNSDSILFNILYDDNDPGNDSGVGDIGAAVAIDAILSNNNNALTIANGQLVLNGEF